VTSAHDYIEVAACLNGEDPVAYILSVNIERRSLTAGQKAMARAIMYPEPNPAGRAGGIVKGLNNSDRVMLSQARAILRWSPLGRGAKACPWRRSVASVIVFDTRGQEASCISKSPTRNSC